MTIDQIMWLLAVICWGIAGFNVFRGADKTGFNWFALGFMFAGITMLT